MSRRKNDKHGNVVVDHLEISTAEEALEHAVETDNSRDGNESPVRDDGNGFEYVAVAAEEALAFDANMQNGGARPKKKQDKQRKSSSQFEFNYFVAFRSLFLANNQTLRNLKLMCLNERLQYPQFRVSLWSVFLDLLPFKVNDWPGLVQSRRERYRIMKSSVLSDDRNSKDIDLNVNNPLSQDEKSPWKKYFDDSQLREEIQRDVVRTNPTNAWLSSDLVKNMMMDILFIYAKKYPEMAYRQGMHEILASLILVQHDSCVQFEKAFASCISSSKTIDLPVDAFETLKLVNDSNHVEADVFFLFEKIMEKMWDWYDVSCEAPKSTLGSSKDDPSFTLFQNPRDRLLLKSTRQLQHIWDHILQNHDQELYNHLQANYVIPATFGTNWTRLIFSRQLRDYLIVWDAVIATNFILIDYVVVAMVVAIRRLLLEGDSIKCNILLVSKYPSIVNESYVVCKALNIWNPLRYPEPRSGPFKPGTPNMEEAYFEGRSRSNSTSSATLDKLRKSLNSKFGGVQADVKKLFDLKEQKKNPEVDGGNYSKGIKAETSPNSSHQRLFDLREHRKAHKIGFEQRKAAEAALEQYHPVTVDRFELPGTTGPPESFEDLRDRLGAWNAQLVRTLKKAEDMFRSADSERIEHPIKGPLTELRLIQSEIAEVLILSGYTRANVDDKTPHVALDALEFNSEEIPNDEDDTGCDSNDKNDDDNGA